MKTSEKPLGHLQLNGENFNHFAPATQERRWIRVGVPSIVLMTQSLLLSQKQASPTILVCMDHCCRKHHCSFEVCKCGSADCNICKPVTLLPDVFKRLKRLPDPTPGVDNYFLPFQGIPPVRSTEHPSTQRNRRKHFHSLPV